MNKPVDLTCDVALADLEDEIKSVLANKKLPDDARRLINKLQILLGQNEREVERLDKEVDEKQAVIDDWDHDDAVRVDELQDTLDKVKYWLHDFLYFHRVTATPRDILKLVERT